MDSLPQQQLSQALDGFNIGGNARVHIGNAYGINQAAPNRPETPPSPLSTVPFPRDPDFVDRSSILDEIDQKLVDGTRVALVGLGGVGKSQLAIEWSYRKRDESQNTWVLWIHASSAARFEQSIRHILDQLKVAERSNPQANVFQLLRTWLYDARKGKWLIIIDNADDVSFLLEPPAIPGQVAQHMSRERRLDYVPACSHGSLLITSRNRAAALKIVEHSDIIDVGSMEEGDALALLTKKLGQVNDQDELVKLATELEHMPLAIVQAASYINQRAPRCTVRQYIEKLAKNDKSRSSLLDRDEGDLRRDREAKNSIILTWEISFEHIHRSRRTAADLLSLMSFFDRQAIQAKLLKSRPPNQEKVNRSSTGTETDNSESHASDDSSSSTDESNSMSDTEDEEFEDDLKTLRDFSFLSITAEVGIFEMHRLIQLATQRWLKANDTFERWGLQFMSNLDDAFPESEFENWNECQLLFPHAVAALELRLVKKEAILRQASVLLRSGHYARNKGAYFDAEKMTAKSVALRQRVLGDEHLDTMLGKARLAIAYKDLGRYTEAETLLVHNLEWSKRMFGDDNDITSMIKHNLAGTYEQLGRYKEAEQLGLESLEYSKRMLGEEHPTTMRSKSNLASTYHVLGRYSEAEQLGSEVLTWRKRFLGDGHPETRLSKNTLASIYGALGKYEEAEELLLEVLDGMEQVLGENHPNIVTGKANLASVYRDLGRFSEAEELESRVLEWSERVLGNEHPDTMTGRNNLAITHADLGKFQESHELLLQVFEWRTRVFGDRHPDTVSSMASLASAHWNLEHEDIALDLMRRAASLSSIVLGGEHPRSIDRHEWVAKWTEMRDKEGQGNDDEQRESLPIDDDGVV